MRAAAVFCNVLVFAVTGVIVLTEGVPRDSWHLVFTFLVLLVPPLSAVALVRARVAPEGPRPRGDGSSVVTLTRRTAVLGNLVLLGALCWEIVVQYPYSEGNSVIPFAVLTVEANG